MNLPPWNSKLSIDTAIRISCTSALLTDISTRLSEQFPILLLVISFITSGIFFFAVAKDSLGSFKMTFALPLASKAFESAGITTTPSSVQDVPTVVPE